jgi:single-strand DNA-binding protein
MSVNSCTFIGNLTRQPELKYLPNGTPVCEFGIACNEKYKDKDGQQQESVEFVNVIAWRGLAEVCGKYLDVGKSVYILGKLKTKNWEKDGVKHYRSEIHADNMQMIGGKGDSNQNQNNQGQSQNSNAGSNRGSAQNNNSNGGQSNFNNPPFNPDDGIPFN